jgi:hypothetical protein
VIKPLAQPENQRHHLAANTVRNAERDPRKWHNPMYIGLHFHKNPVFQQVKYLTLRGGLHILALAVLEC